MQQEVTYDDYPVADFPVEDRDELDVTTYTGTPEAPLTMDTPDVTIARWGLKGAQEERTIVLQPDEVYSIYVLNGSGTFCDCFVGECGVCYLWGNDAGADGVDNL